MRILDADYGALLAGITGATGGILVGLSQQNTVLAIGLGILGFGVFSLLQFLANEVYKIRKCDG